MHFSVNSLILLGIGAQLLGSLAKTLFKKPAQQAQIDRIEAKVSAALDQIAPVVSALNQPSAMAGSAAAKGTPQ